MIKTIALLKRKSGLSHEQFVEYYENRHAPFIRSMLPGIVEYRRNYLDPDGAHVSPGAAPVDFDVITEIWFADRAAYDEAMAVLARPDNWAALVADEGNLFDRDKTRMFVVREAGASCVKPVGCSVREPG